MINMAAFEEIGTFSDRDFSKSSATYIDELKAKYTFKEKQKDFEDKRYFPKWHVSYYQNEEKEHFEKVLLELGWGRQRLEFYNDIGKCLDDFRVK